MIKSEILHPGATESFWEHSNSRAEPNNIMCLQVRGISNVLHGLIGKHLFSTLIPANTHSLQGRIRIVRLSLGGYLRTRSLAGEDNFNDVSLSEADNHVLVDTHSQVGISVSLSDSSPKSQSCKNAMYVALPDTHALQGRVSTAKLDLFDSLAEIHFRGWGFLVIQAICPRSSLGNLFPQPRQPFDCRLPIFYAKQLSLYSVPYTI